jgi:hypothetical protein
MMTRRRDVRQIVANIMGDPVPSGNLKSQFARVEAVLLYSCACALLEHKIFLLALRINRLIKWGTILWLPSVLLLDGFVVGTIYYFFVLPSRWRLATSMGRVASKGFAIIVACFAIFSTCASMVLLVETGI